MKIEAMHDKNRGFRLIGYRIVAENRDEERILNLSEWSVQREHFSPDSALHLVLSTTETEYTESSAGTLNAKRP